MAQKLKRQTAVWLSIVMLTIFPLFADEQSNSENDFTSDSGQKKDQSTKERRYDALLGDTLKNIPDVLAENEEKHEGLFKWDPTEPIHKIWTKVDKRLEKNFNLNVGIAYTSLYQRATTKLHTPGKRFYQGAAGGDFDLFGVLTLVDYTKCYPSSIGFASESRQKFSSIPPRLLGDNIGSLWGTVNTFNVQQYSLIQLWWEQHLIKDRFGFRLGKIDLTDYFDLYKFISSNFSFLSEALTDCLTIDFPSNGFGLVVGAALTRSLYIRAAIADANAIKTSMSFDTFFSLHEYFTAVEFGYKPKNKRFGNGNYNVTFWHSDARKKLHLPETKGIAFSFEQEIRKGIIPFVRFSFSDGKVRPVKQAISSGIGYVAPFSRKDDECAIGFAWGRPSQKNLQDQYLIEAYYRLQLTPHFQVSPDIQVLIHPTYNPKKDVIGVFGVRVRYDI